ncbi:MAG: LysR family transcriptional regulator [Sphingomonas sp.]
MDRIGELSTFVKVVDAGSFRSAAAALSLSPSTISKLVLRLELRLGARLLNRTSRSFSLTPEGSLLYEKAVAAVRAVEDAENMIILRHREPSGKLRVHCSPTFAISQLAPIIPEFADAHPAIDIELVTGTMSVDMAASNIDVLFEFAALRDSSVIGRRIAISRWVICASPTYLATHGVPDSPADLVNHNCLNFLPHNYWQEWLIRGAQARGVKPRGRLSSNNAGLLRQLAVQDFGIVRLPMFQIVDDLNSGRLIDILAEHDSELEYIYLYYQRQERLPPRVRLFVDFVVDKLSKLVWAS